MIGGAFREHAGGIRHGHPETRRGTEVDMVRSRAPNRQQPQFRTGGEHALREKRAGADIEDCLDSALNIVSNDWKLVSARLKARGIVSD